MTQKVLPIDHYFDRKSCRHFVNGESYVLHCHHYATLYCQLADDADEMFNGIALLVKSTEMAFVPELEALFDKANAETVEERVALAEDYYRFMGMGILHMDKVGSMAASARMTNSHVDEGWIKKWGNRDKPVNFIGQGYLAAAMDAVYGLPAGNFEVRELKSIVAGAKESKFSIVRK